MFIHYTFVAYQAQESFNMIFLTYFIMLVERLNYFLGSN